MKNSITASRPTFALRRNIFVTASAVAIALLFGGAAVAQDDDANEDIEANDEQVIDEIVVEGIRSSLESAVMTKRNADNIVDAITAEGIGRFPDLNLAESIQRISGIQIIRDEFRDGRVAIRGLPGLTKTQFNGQDLASPNFSGGFLYGIFESSVLSGVDVQKTPTVRMDAGGIGGIVNLKTRRPLEFDQNRHFFIQTKAQYEELPGEIIPDVGMSAGIKNAAENLGAYISIGYQERDFRSDAARISNYRAFDVDGNRVTDITDENSADLTYVPADFRYVSRHTTGQRTSIAGGAEWQVNDEFNLGLVGIFANSDSAQPLNEIRAFPNGPRSFIQGTDFIVNSTTDAGRLGETALDVTYISPAMQVQERLLDQEYETWATTFDGSWQRGPWSVTGALHHTEGRRFRFLAQVVSRIDSRRLDDRTLVDNGLVLDLNTGGHDPNGFNMVLNQNPNDVNTFGYGTTNTALDDGDHLYARIFAGSESADRIEYQDAGQFDVLRDLEFSFLESVEFGGKYRQLRQNNAQKHYRNDRGLDLTGLDNSFFHPSYFSEGAGFMSGDLQNQGLLVPDAPLVFGSVTPANPADVRPGELIDPAYGLIYAPISSGLFQNTQDILALYGNVNLGFNIGRVGVRGNVGVRYVDTSRNSKTTTATQISGVVERINISVDTDFDHVLPQLNLIFDLSDSLVLRTSFAETMSRPDPNSLTAGNFVRVDIDELSGDVTRIRAFSDRSGILPFTADSIDVAVEWYNREGSVVSAALFTKDISNAVRIIDDCPATILGVEELITGTPTFVSPGLCQDEAGVEIVAPRRVNVSDSFRINGIEVGTTQNFDFLPGFWSNFGVTANYTFLDADESANEDSAGNVLPLNDVSEHSFNFIGYYETERFGIRVANNYRSEFLAAAGGTFFGDERLVGDRSQWDISASFDITDNIRIGFEALNLTDEDRHEYQGDTARFRNLSKEGRTFTLSASWQL